MNVTEDVIQQLVVETVASQDEETVGVMVIVVGKDSLSVGGIGATPSLEDFSQALARFDQRNALARYLH